MQIGLRKSGTMTHFWDYDTIKF